MGEAVSRDQGQDRIDEARQLRIRSRKRLRLAVGGRGRMFDAKARQS